MMNPQRLCRFLSTQTASNQINFIHTEHKQSLGVSGLYSVHSDRHHHLSGPTAGGLMCSLGACSSTTVYLYTGTEHNVSLVTSEPALESTLSAQICNVTIGPGQSLCWIHLRLVSSDRKNEGTRGRGKKTSAAPPPWQPRVHILPRLETTGVCVSEGCLLIG